MHAEPAPLESSFHLQTCISVVYGRIQKEEDFHYVNS